MSQKVILCEGIVNEDVLSKYPMDKYMSEGYKVSAVSGFSSTQNDPMCYVFLDREDVEIPTFSPESGGFTDSVDVTISCATEGATIYWSKQEGLNPWTAYTEYEEPVTITHAAKIRAFAEKNGVKSETAEKQYLPVHA